MKVSYAISELINKFCNDADVKENSRKLYKLNLKRFFIWLSAKGKDQRTVYRADIIEYKNDMLSKHEVTTAESYLVAVKMFYKWLGEKDWHANVASGIKMPRRNRVFKKKALLPDQISTLLNGFELSTDKGKRDYAIVNMMLRNGLRCTEVIRFNIGDICEENGKLGINVWGKARNDKVWMPLTDKAFDPVHDYLLTRKKLNDDQPLFASLAYNNRSGRLSPVSLSTIIKQKMIKVGINDKHITAHSLRHTTAQMLLRAGVELYEVQKYLRHTSSKTTEIYMQSINDELIHRNNPGKKLDELF
ncbi:tyrosine-type recombinase/integrase [Marinifilum flexuosum]|uniref:Integrase/recombinase XerC/integrase/recombinase XerD n=1 Tax=Marinifilum flexuosum TaxID=1117708 RepID=A0A419WMP9_9BACT|nr:tyrosine-type recombinase/integrase [Marinifilum flexuosum]RKD96760.1 integrase/recombinase XerC/integrase/recombinase XerD [Marinifilum flexuosum]